MLTRYQESHNNTQVYPNDQLPPFFYMMSYHFLVGIYLAYIDFCSLVNN